MAEKKVLNLAKPLLKTWASESFVMSMILQQENAMDWVMNNYINMSGQYLVEKEAYCLCFFPNPDPYSLDVSMNIWNSCPFLETHFTAVDYVNSRYENILEYVMAVLEEGYYVCLFLSPGKLGISKRIKSHKTLVYGFDRAKNTIYVADHYDDGRFACAEVGCQQFLDAYEEAQREAELEYQEIWPQYFVIPKKQVIISRPRPYEYTFHPDWFRLQLKDYLEGTYSLHSTSFIYDGETGNDRCFGINCYELVQRHLDHVIDAPQLLDDDWRLATALYDHKYLLLQRARYFCQKGICDFEEGELAQYETLYQSAEIVMNRYLKFIVTNQIRHLKKIKELLVEMKSLELELLPRLLTKIS